MSIKQKIKVKTFTGSGSFDVREEMLKDSTDLLDNVEVTTIAQECVKLKTKEDEIAKLEEQLKRFLEPHTGVPELQQLASQRKQWYENKKNEYELFHARERCGKGAWNNDYRTYDGKGVDMHTAPAANANGGGRHTAPAAKPLGKNRGRNWPQHKKSLQLSMAAMKP